MYEKSGQSVSEFCRANDLPPATLSLWRSQQKTGAKRRPKTEASRRNPCGCADRGLDSDGRADAAAQRRTPRGTDRHRPGVARGAAENAVESVIDARHHERDARLPEDRNHGWTARLRRTERAGHAGGSARIARSGHLFVFCNRRANRVKLLWYHDGGFYIAAKRMDRGTVDWPRNNTGAARMSRAIAGVAQGRGVQAAPRQRPARYRR